MTTAMTFKRRGVALLLAAITALGGAAMVTGCDDGSSSGSQNPSWEKQMEDSQQKSDAYRDFDMDGQFGN